MKTKTARVIALVMLVLVVIMAGIVIYLELNTGRLAGKYLQDRFAESELSQVYELDYESLKIGIFSGKAKLKGLKVKPVSTFFAPDNPLRLKYPVVFEIDLRQLVITGVTRNVSLNLTDISLDAIKIIQPSVKMIEHLTEKEKQQLRNDRTKQKSDTTGANESLPHTVLSFFTIRDGRFEVYDNELDRSVVSIEKINVSGYDFDLKPDSADIAAMVNAFDSLNTSLAEITYPTADGFYVIKLASLSLSTQESAISATGFNLIPQYSKPEFGRKFGKQTDRFDITVKKIGIEQFSMDKWLNEKQLWIEQINIGGNQLDIYRDKNIARDLSIFPKLPHQAFADLDMGINIDKIKIGDTDLIYQEVAEGETEPGIVRISNGQAEVLNVSNVVSSEHVEKTMQWQVNGDLYDQGTFEVVVGFSGDHESGEFNFSGRVGQMEMSPFNQILVPNEFIRIEDGQISFSQFQVDAGADYSTGTMQLVYDDLKIALLKEDKGDELKVRSFYSSLANTAIRLFNSDEHEAKAQSASIYFERDKNKSIINYIVKSLLSGVKATIMPGQNKPPEKRQKKQEKEELRKGRRKS